VNDISDGCGVVSIRAAGLIESALTFRKATSEKLIFVGLNLVDLVLTLFAISIGLKELNPFLITLSSNPFQMLFIKLLLPLFFAWLSPGKLLIPSIAFLTLVLGWNVKELIIYFI
jgi:hypothetical protein